jgi:hypothetical protein
MAFASQRLCLLRPAAAPGLRAAAAPAATAAPLLARRGARLTPCGLLPARVAPLVTAPPPLCSSSPRSPARRGVAARPPRATRRSSAPPPPPPAASPAADFGSGLTFAALWVGLIAYVALWSPNQTPVRDQYFLEKLVGLGMDDGVALNAVWFCLFNIMGVWPAVYAALLTPAGRSANGVRAWRHARSRHVHPLHKRLPALGATHAC